MGNRNVIGYMGSDKDLTQGPSHVTQRFPQ